MRNQKPKGFTLIEVMISLAIFTLIGITTVKQIRQISDTKVSAFEQLDLYDGLRTAVSVMRNDIQQAFHVQYDDLSKEAQKAILNNQPVSRTLFDGRKSEIIFTTVSHRVYYTGKKESTQSEISYFLQRKPGRKTQSLMKRETGIIDSDLYQGGEIYTILDDVTSLEFQYWDKKAQKWLPDWNSDAGLQTKRFPLAVKMKMTVAKNDKSLDVETDFKIAFPNNKKYVAEF